MIHEFVVGTKDSNISVKVGIDIDIDISFPEILQGILRSHYFWHRSSETELRSLLLQGVFDTTNVLHSILLEGEMENQLIVTS